MNIIFGNQLAQQAQEKYTVLELDTFNLLPTDEVITAYCLVESIPIEEMSDLENLKQQHSDLMADYRNRRWQSCEQAMSELTGKWNGDLDSFYEELHRRIQTLKQCDLPENWTGRVNKTVEVV